MNLCYQNRRAKLGGKQSWHACFHNADELRPHLFKGAMEKCTHVYIHLANKYIPQGFGLAKIKYFLLVYNPEVFSKGRMPSVEDKQPHHRS